MFNAFIVFLSVMILGAIIFGTAFTATSGFSTRFIKWFFGIFFILGIVAAILTLVGVIQL
ncbi:hypothetical protein J4772_26235 [Cohnella sp. LGH]|uniref:hypothetical protein n=1 Tax=Cohnella sp. LGH TaxID=1619153 RepID=UPI001ADB7A4A|nr:hypothetical protein [Cohnella sp. LGH]QTH41028.1 hypothetical protein J4772_26235 [Cohnella sp. LGH]